MAKDPEILRFLTTEPFREMLQTYARLKPLAEGPEGPFSEALKKYDFTQAYPLFDQYLSTHDLSTPEAIRAAEQAADTDTVAFATTLTTLFQTTLEQRMITEYDVLGNSPATYFICGVWANMKRGREFHPASNGITVTYSDVDAYGNQNVKYRNRDYEMTLIFNAVQEYTKSLSWTAHRLLVYTLMRGNRQKNDLKSITSVPITEESFKEYFESFYTTHLATEAEITKYTGEVRITFAEKVRHFLTQYYQLIPDWMGQLTENTYRMAFYLFYRARKAPTAKDGSFRLNIQDIIHYIGLPTKEEVKNRNYDEAIIRPFNKAVEEIERISGGAIRMSFPYDNITDFLSGQMEVEIDNTMMDYLQKIEQSRTEKLPEAKPKKRRRKTEPKTS